MQPHIIAIYHADCPDGTTAAACLLAKYPDAKVFPLSHAYTPQELQTILDQVTSETIAYTLDCVIGVKELAERAMEVHIIDHHASAEAATRELTTEMPNITYTFDNAHSGASLSWLHFNPDTPIPELITLVEMDDLYSFTESNRERARLIVVHLMTMLNRPEVVVPLLAAPVDPLLETGKIMLTYQESLTRQFATNAQPLTLRIGDFDVPCYNIMMFGNFFDSDIKAALLEMHPCAIGAFSLVGDSIRISFRSEEGMHPTALDLATTLAGGGHQHAAGARMTRIEFFKALG